MKRLLSVLIVFGIALGMVGCSDDDPTNPQTDSEFEMLAAAGDDYFNNYTTPSGLGVNVTADVAYTAMTNVPTDDDYDAILDWRGSVDYAAGHIAGAVNVSLGNFETALNGIPLGAKVLNVCYTGQTASYTTSLMNMMGYNAQNLKFGMCGWTTDAAIHQGKWDGAISDDYNTWLTTVASTSTETYDFPDPGTGQDNAYDVIMDRAGSGWKTISVGTLYADIEVNNKADDYFIINYFNAPQYDAGHIPGAVRFQPKADLDSDAKLNTIPTDKKVVVYCFTGQTSAQAVAYLNALGYDAYSLKFGVNAMCYSNGNVCTTQYHAPVNDYPVVTD